MVRDGLGNTPEVWEGPGDARGSLRQVGGPSGVRDGLGVLPEVWDRTGDSRGGPGRVGGPSRWSGTVRGTLPVVKTGRGTLGEVWDSSGDTPGGPGLEEPMGRSGSIWWTIPEVWDGYEDSPGGPGQVGGPSQRSRTGRGTFG